MIVHLIRHGQSFNTHREPGEPYPPNPPLTTVGVEQSRRLADRLTCLPIERLVSSPMLRTVETAAIVGKRIGRQVEVWTRSYEYRRQTGYQAWGAREVLARYPDVKMPADFGPEDWQYGEEALESAVERADALIAWLHERAVEASIGQMAVVTHGAYTRLVLGRLLDVDPARLQPVVLDHTSLTSLRIEPERRQVLALNDTAHLSGAGEADPLAGLAR